MADPEFRETQRLHCYDPHIAPLNALVDELRRSTGKWLPHIAPMYGGVRARLLSVLRDPGPMTQDGVGSGFLCMENDDATAEAIDGYFAEAGILAQDIVPWNAYPWYINRKPNAAELRLGFEPLKRVIELLPALRVIMLHGGSARAAWRGFVKTLPHGLANVEVLATYHTSRQAFWHRDSQVRERRRRDLRSTFAHAAAILRTDRPSV